ncbi:MAG: SMC family ATPase [Thermoplasmatales archaeon]|nr:MAG: SMC family ATPase [Thermoplasmatales archaeon]
MNLRTLTIKNFRKFKDTTIDFPDGVTGIVGLNGAGKSTIFEAIAWVLYGPVAARTPSDQIKRQGADNSATCRVELDFEFENDKYRIIREMKGKSLTATATATINGKVAATSAESVTRFIQKKLGMDFKSFFTSIFAKQKELNALSSMNASDRRPLILRMLGIDSLDLIIKEIRSDKKNKELLIKEISKDIINEIGKNKDEIYNEEIKIIQKEKKEIETLIKKLKLNNQSNKKDIKNLEKENQKLKNNYEKLNKQKEKLSEYKNLFEQKKQLMNEIKNLKNKISFREKNLINEKKKLEKYTTIEDDIKKNNKRLNEINKQLEKLLKTIEQKKTLSKQYIKDISEINIKKGKIEKIGPDAKCPTCDRILSDQYNTLIKKFEKEKTEKEKQNKIFFKNIKNKQSEKDSIIREQIALEKKKNYFLNKIREKEKINTIINHLSQEIKHEKKEFENKQFQIKKIGVISFNEKDFNNVKKQIEQFYKDYQKSITVLNDKKDEFSEIILKIEKKEGELNLINQKMEDLKNKIKEIEDIKKKISEEKNSLRFISILSNIMNDFRIHLISRIRPTLSSYSTDFFIRLTDGKYPEIELDENYDIIVYDNGEKYSINRFSGGEEDLANLCLRLAISEVITERAGGIFNFIILDEIFGSQDDIRRHNIMKSLSSLSGKFRQIFLITHVEDVKNDMENIIYVNENQEGISTIKIE